MNETTAQEASGATIAAWEDLRVDLFFTLAAMARSSRIDTACLVERLAPRRPRGRGRCRTRGRIERAHRSLENRGRFPTSAHRHHRVSDHGEGRQLSATACDRPATITEFRCGRQRRSFANPSPAEIVVVNRQK